MWAVTSHSCCIVSFAPVYYTKYNGLGRHWQSPGDSREMIAGEFDRKWSLTRMQSCKGLELIWTRSEHSVNKQELLQMVALIRSLLKGVLSHSHVGNPIHLCHGEKREGMNDQKIEKCNKNPTVSFQVTQSSGPLKGSFLWRASCVFWRLSVLPSSPWAKVIKLRTKTQFFSPRPPKHVFVTVVSDDVCPVLFFLMLAGVQSILSQLPYLII